MPDRRRGPKWWPLRSGIPEDVRGRLSWYKHDWVEGWNSNYRLEKIAYAFNSLQVWRCHWDCVSCGFD